MGDNDFPPTICKIWGRFGVSDFVRSVGGSGMRRVFCVSADFSIYFQLVSRGDYGTSTRAGRRPSSTHAVVYGGAGQVAASIGQPLAGLPFSRCGCRSEPVDAHRESPADCPQTNWRDFFDEIAASDFPSAASDFPSAEIEMPLSPQPKKDFGRCRSGAVDQYQGSR